MKTKHGPLLVIFLLNPVFYAVPSSNLSKKEKNSVSWLLLQLPMISPYFKLATNLSRGQPGAMFGPAITSKYCDAMMQSCSALMQLSV